MIRIRTYSGEHVAKPAGLDLSYSKVTDDDLKGIVELTKLKLVYLDNTKITDNGLAHLVKLPHLSEVRLQKTAISDAGIMKLVDMSVLESLNAQGTKVTLEGYKRFKKLRPKVNLTIGRLP